MKESFNLERNVRANIMNLKPYSCARNEFNGNSSILLDANENPYGSPLNDFYNRYPDPLQNVLKQKLSDIKKVSTNSIFLGNGSDEAIDIILRTFCDPGADNIILFTPTYGMYEVVANINNVSCKHINLTSKYQLDLPQLFSKIDEHTKLIFICSPNNPTGNNFREVDILSILSVFNGIVVVKRILIFQINHPCLRN